MGLFKDLFGGTSVDISARPDMPLASLRKRMEGRITRLFDDPLGSPEYANFRRGVDERLSKTRNRSIDALSDSATRPGGVGIRSGAYDQARLSIESEIGSQDVQATSAFVQNLLQLPSEEFFKLFAAMSNFEVGTFGAQQSGKKIFSEQGMVSRLGEAGQSLGQGASGLSGIPGTFGFG